MKAMIIKGALSLAVAAGLLTTPFASAANAQGDPTVESEGGGSEVINEDHDLVEGEVGNPDGISPDIESGKMGGGYWIRGKKWEGIAYVYSSYKHYTKQGHTSVVNGHGDYKSGGWKSKDVFSTAKLPWITFNGTNKAYYNYK
ncbi:lactococcin 972 family bacteriocin [Desmospora activa]|uniref:Lactococcin 972 family bacteriocin n=1 Tax=Desmospora activa DSM 45169 TaxID=1121389 RepID=A0A2T4Z4K1_9BACL|nr:lactococcin 972 family bacteriocin [Desmospora activa]PTM56819.1 hypothetical protein C8J48_3144 [Desmospora activa DSM 45169]